MRNRRWCEMDRRRRENGVTGRHRVRMRWGNWGRTDRLRASRGGPQDRQTDGRDKRVPWVACILLCLLAN